MYIKRQNNPSSRIILFTIATVCSQVIGIVTAPIFTRILTASDYGAVSVFMTWSSIFNVIIGVQTYAVLNNVRIDFPERDFPSFCSSALSLSFSCFVVVLGLSWVFASRASSTMQIEQFLLVPLVIYSFALYCMTFFFKYLMVKKLATAYLLLSLANTISGSLLSVILTMSIPHKKYLGKIIGMGFSSVLLATVILGFFWVTGKRFFDKTYWKYCVKMCIPLVFHNLVASVTEQSDRLMINGILGSSFAGIYSFCYTIASPMNALWFAFNNSWTPDYYDYLQKKDMITLQTRSKNYRFTFSCITIGFLFVSPEIAKLLSPQQYWSGIPIIPLVALSYYFTFLYGFAANFLFYQKRTANLFTGSFIACIANILLNLWLIPQCGMIGAAIATLVSAILQLVIQDLMARSLNAQYHYSYRFYLAGLVPVLLAAIFVYVSFELWVIRWVMGFIVGIILLVRIYKNKSIF